MRGAESDAKFSTRCRRRPGGRQLAFDPIPQGFAGDSLPDEPANSDIMPGRCQVSRAVAPCIESPLSIGFGMFMEIGTK